MNQLYNITFIFMLTIHNITLATYEIKKICMYKFDYFKIQNQIMLKY